MNAIRSTQELNKRELELCTPPNASWHADYRYTAFVYVGGLPLTLTEGDVLTIFSQFGTPTFIKLARDKETGKSKGFGWLKYEDQRSTDLAVDNLGGAVVVGRRLRVDHAVYKAREGEEVKDNVDVDVAAEIPRSRHGKKTSEDEYEEGDGRGTRLKEEMELDKMLRDMDDEDPMKEYLIQEKRAEVEQAVANWTQENSRASQEDRRKHKHHHRKYNDSVRHSGGHDDSDVDNDRLRRRSEHRHRRRRSRSPR